VRSEANRRLQCKQWGAKLILLPQAFGPFENPQIKSICSELFTQADLIFPRDNRSYQYVNALLPASEGTKKVHLAPDFTNIVQGFVPKSFDSTLHGAVAVLPNEKMIAKKGEEEAKKYLDFLVHSIRSLREKNIPHFILAHQQQDKKVIDLLRTQIDPFPEVVTESNALFIKGILGTCRFLIGSRFHGLVNGLSQGVPCICTSWSHKYEALFEDYHCSDFLISDLSALNQVDQLILRLSDETTYRSIRENIETQSSRIKEETKTLWGIVDTFLQNNIH
jgi:colanic acid/amylovoran biosynthesis protein